MAALFWLLLAAAPMTRGEEGFPLVTNVRQFHDLGTHRQRITCRLRLTGVVAWSSATGDRLVALDDTGAELVELGGAPGAFRPGQRVRLEGLCSGGGVGEDRRMGPALVVDNDGVHAKAEKSGSVSLSAGRHPFILTWFNRENSPALDIWYEGPSLPRQKIPGTALFQPDSSRAGVAWKAYEGDWWQLPDFNGLTPVKTGIAPTLSPEIRTREALAAVQFAGALEIPRDGLYTFSTASKDGSQLWMPLVEATVLGETAPPKPHALWGSRFLTNQDEAEWCVAEGTVTFAGGGAGAGAELELATTTGKMRVKVSNTRDWAPQTLWNSRVRVTGLARATFGADGHEQPGLLWAPGAEQVEVLEHAPAEANDFAGDDSELPTLTTVEEIKRLKHADALRGYPVHVRGVITWSGGSAVVLQDATAGIFVSQTPVADADGARTGEYWDIEGISYAQFSPMILARRVVRLGLGALPEPLHPTWDQLINGSLDTQFVEVRGVVTDLQSNAVMLLTPGGRIQLDLPETRPESLLAFKNARVRVRGCLWAVKDDVTHLFKIGAVQIHGAAISVEQPAPADLFDAPRKRAADLLLFDAQAGSLQRVKVAGQVAHGNGQEFFLMDETNGLRFLPKSDPHLAPGALVEVVGFPDLNGPSPTLREAVARQTGAAPLPAPLRLTEETLLAGAHDGILVKVEARLVKVGGDQRETVLGLQLGARTFAARLDAKSEWAQSLQPGSTLEVMGVYAGHGGDRAAGRDIDSFELLLNAPSDIRVVAQPPWWTLRRLLAMMGILLAVLGMATIWIWLLRRRVEQRTAELRTEILERERAQHQQAVEAERSRIARDLHDDLGASLTEISLLADAGPGAPPTLDRAAQRFHTIGDKARAMVGALDVIVWLVNPRKDVLPFLVGYVGSYAEEYLGNSGIGCRLRLPMDIPPIRLSTDVRHNVFLAVRETLHNIVQHAHASEVVMELAMTDDHLRITILDNGQGFDAASCRNGNGLSNLRERLAGMGGVCEISAQPEEGTRVSLALPLPRYPDTL